MKTHDTLPLAITDHWVQAHLKAWVASRYRIRPDAYKLCADFCASNPDVLERLGWPEIYNLAIRNALIKDDPAYLTSEFTS
jgi:hypothetical protein